MAASIHLTEGTNSTVEATPRVLDVVASLDRSTSLAEAVRATAGRLALSETETSQLLREVLDVARELLELGALEFHGK